MNHLFSLISVILFKEDKEIIWKVNPMSETILKISLQEKVV